MLDSLLEGNPVKAMDALRHLILPGIVLAAFTMGLITRTTRSNLLDALSTDYSRTAKAKELGSLGLIISHALGNALIPVMTAWTDLSDSGTDERKTGSKRLHKYKSMHRKSRQCRQSRNH